MNSILVLNGCVLGGESVSKPLVDEAVRRPLERNPRATVIHRDLGSAPIPHLTTANVAGVRGVPTTEVELAARALSDQLIAELQAADTLVIGAPMYNFSIPTGLKAWFDYVLRPGKTFSYLESGPRGLLTGKRVIIIDSRPPRAKRNFVILRSIILAALTVTFAWNVALSEGPGADRFHRVLYVGDYKGGGSVGEVVALSRVSAMLYLDDRCVLPIAGAENMFKFISLTEEGCWYPTPGGGLTVLQKELVGKGYVSTAWEPAVVRMMPEGVFNSANSTLTVTKVKAPAPPGTNESR
jgi:FMN-dependent NADH-azoreductase